MKSIDTIKPGLEQGFIYGKYVGNTLEMPSAIGLDIPRFFFEDVFQEIRKRAPIEVLEREKKEYDELIHSAYNACKVEFERDPVGRRAIVLHPGCLTYQHFYVRGGELIHQVHMRSMDIRKLEADLSLLLRTEQKILTLPLGRIEIVKLRVTIDCFHRYLKEEEVPL